MMADISRKHARQSIEHAKESVELLKMSRHINEARRKGLVDERTAAEAVARLNAEAVVEIETALRLQRKALVEIQMRSGN